MSPKFPRLPLPHNPLGPVREAIRESRQQVGKAGSEIRALADELRNVTTIEPPKKTEAEPKAAGTACLTCTRDHFSTCSSALAEALRFARSDGMKNPEVTRRLGIALDELNILERIDLAAGQIGLLSEPERKLAIWSLNESRGLRHAISGANTPEGLETAAAEASKVREEFMKKFWEIEEECPECFSLTKLREFIDRKRKEREDK